MTFNPTSFLSDRCLFETLRCPAEKDKKPGRLSRTFSLSLDGRDLGFVFSENIADLQDRWDTLVPAGLTLLRSEYLAVLEASPPAGFSFSYLLVHDHDKPLGVFYFQRTAFQLNRNLPVTGQEGKPSLGRRLLGDCALPVLVCGNLLLTGAYGWYLRPGAEKLLRLLPDAQEKVARLLEQAGKPVRILMAKDLSKDQRSLTDRLAKDGYHDLRFQPAMDLELPAGWARFDDYLDALTSKYRVRVRRAIKKARQVERRQLDEAEVARYEQPLFRLYGEVAGEAEFNLVELAPAYFRGLCNLPKEDFRLMGYFLGGDLVGFYTTLRHGDCLEAHFLGFDREANRSYQLYLNMLYDIIGDAIAAGIRSVHFARTALEIKSSVGALPAELSVWVKHRSPLANRVLPGLIQSFTPEAPWQPRHPFGAD